jgi:hypothetical protein
MDLDELCRSEGLDPDALEETVAWARARADELVAGLVADAELGPILDAVWEEESALNVLPPLDPLEHDSDASGPMGVEEASAALEVAPPPDYDDGRAYEEPSSSSEVPAEGMAEAEAGAQPEAAASAEPTTLRDMIADGARPVLGLPPIPGSYQAAPMKEMTQEIDADEIEMLDDDELELMMDDEPAAGPPTNEPPPSSGGDVPEWQQALNSAQLGGGSQADHDSGLLRIHPPGTRPPEPTPDE